MNTKKLKQLVLDLAIHGKLVPQDPNDEPASELLKRIQADVETLGRASNKSKGKKSAVSSVDLDEVPFEVPEGWCWTRLGDCFFMQAGKNVKAEDISEEQTECAQYRCFGGNGLRGYVNSYNHNGRFPIIGRQGALCGNVNFAEGEFYATEHAVPVHTFAGTDPMWAYHFLKVLNLNQYATATAQPGLSVKVIEDVFIPLPPLSEQHRIVAAIEKWFAVIDQLEKNEADLKKSIEQTKKKVLDLAIRGKLVAQNPEDEPAGELLARIRADVETHGRASNKAKGKKSSIPSVDLDEVPFEVPEGWCWCRLGEISTYGECQSVDVKTINDSEWTLELEDLEKDSARVLSRQTISSRPLKGTRHKFSQGDVLYSKLRTYLNKVLVAKENGYCTTEIIPIKFFGDIDPDFMCHVLRSQYFLDYTMMLGYGVKMPRLSTEDARKAYIPLPPLAEQKRIVAKIEEVFGVLERIEGVI